MTCTLKKSSPILGTYLIFLFSLSHDKRTTMDLQPYITQLPGNVVPMLLGVRPCLCSLGFKALAVFICKAVAKTVPMLSGVR